MNKRAAKDLAYSKSWTAGEIATVLDRRTDEDGMPSSVNPQFTVGDVRGWMEAAFKDRNADDRLDKTSDIMGMTNCFREFGAPKPLSHSAPGRG